ncbi:hypothetical protein SLEP1_g7225 [Rubroshorea leprosula]|uniref:Uncharacterized protein n=1 Tax=Rubroshorea leprosula TaxID=152421 RepID=A0AAV5I5R6_9ROSI|nr:hypothetical protein SLEP1_g7225 [Rubroshorea leprosula]
MTQRDSLAKGMGLGKHIASDNFTVGARVPVCRFLLHGQQKHQG